MLEISINDIFKFVTSVALILYLYSMAYLLYYERKLNKLYENLETSVSKAKERGETRDFSEGEVAKARETARPQIEELERKRRFLLDKMPFIK